MSAWPGASPGGGELRRGAYIEVEHPSTLWLGAAGQLGNSWYRGRIPSCVGQQPPAGDCYQIVDQCEHVTRVGKAAWAVASGGSLCLGARLVLAHAILQRHLSFLESWGSEETI